MRFNKEKIYLILIILITFFAYINILKNDFVWDDEDFIIEWYETRSLGNIPLFFKGTIPPEHGGVYRPIRSIFYALSYKLWKLNPWAYKFQSILVHITCTILIYFVSFQIINKKGIAFISSLTFAVHPIHTEAINLTAASFDIIAVIFFFASFYLYLRSQSNQQKRRFYLATSVVFAILSFFSYEFALTLPLLIVLYDICFRKINRKNFIEKAAIYAFFFSGALFYLFIRFFVLDIGGRGNYIAGSFYLTMLTMAKAFLKYVSLVIFPINLSVNHTIPKGILSLVYLDLNEGTILAQSIFDLDILFSIAVIIILLIIALKNFRKCPLVSFCIGWFFIGLSPVSNIIPQGSLLCEKYLYISSFAFCLLFSFIFYYLYNLAKKNKINFIRIVLTLFFIFMIVSYVILTYSRNRDFKDSLTLWSKTVKQAPNSVIAHDNLGMAYFKEGEFNLAIEEFKTALTIKPDHYKAHSNLGSTYYEKGEIELAIKEFKMALAIKPNYAKAYNNLGAVYHKKGEIELAIKEFKKALAINPDYVNARFNLGNIYYLQGSTDMAIKEYEKILAIDPDNYGARKNLQTAIEKR